MVQSELARSTDAASLLRLREEAASWMQRRQLVQWAPGELTLEAFADQVRAGEWHVLRTAEEKVFAALRLLWSNDETWGPGEPIAGYVHGLMVDRAAAGRGIGAELLDWAGHKTRERGRYLLRLDGVDSNLELRRYYRNQGFSEVARRDFNSDRWHPVTLFERDLRNSDLTADQHLR